MKDIYAAIRRLARALDISAPDPADDEAVRMLINDAIAADCYDALPNRLRGDVALLSDRYNGSRVPDEWK